MRGGAAVTEVDLVADLNAEDDDGLGWSTLAEAREPRRITPGAMVLAGNQAGQAVVRIVAVDADGQIHFTVLPGSVAKNRHLLGHTVA
jgi:pyridoxine/pyridoxamine 5'-phosphate oxidase